MTIAARPTTYSGVAMRSRTEARFAAFLDRVGIRWEYEPRAFASPHGQYLPDFELLLGTARPRAYVDVKGVIAGQTPLDRSATLDLLAGRMAIIWASEPQAALIVAASSGLRRACVGIALNPDIPSIDSAQRTGMFVPGGFGVCGACHRPSLAWRQTGHLSCAACGRHGEVAAYLDPWHSPEAA